MWVIAFYKIKKKSPRQLQSPLFLVRCIICGIVTVIQWFEVTDVVKNVCSTSTRKKFTTTMSQWYAFASVNWNANMKDVFRALRNQFYFWDLSLHYCILLNGHMVWVYSFQENKTHKHACLGIYEANIHFECTKQNANVFVIKNICCVCVSFKLLFILFSVCFRK